MNLELADLVISGERKVAGLNFDSVAAALKSGQPIHLEVPGDKETHIPLDIRILGISEHKDEAFVVSAKLVAAHRLLILNEPTISFLLYGSEAVLDFGGEEAAIPVALLAGKDRATLLKTPIEEMEFSKRTYNALHKAGIKTLEELIAMTETQLRKIKGFWTKGLNEVKEKLAEIKLTLRSEA